MNNHTYFASNLKYLRSKYNVEQLELAEKLGRKSSSSVSEWEKGKYTPKAGTLNDIAKLFNITITELMNEDLTSQTTSTLSRLNSVASQLTSTGQSNVLTFAKEQLKAQEVGEGPALYLVNGKTLDDILDQQVAWQGREISDTDREIVKSAIQKHLEGKERKE